MIEMRVPRLPRRSLLSLLLLSLLTCAAIMATFASSASALSLGLMQSSNGGEDELAREWDVIKHSGATTYRMGLSKQQSFNGGYWGKYDPIFEQAWKHGITILPTLTGSNQSISREFPVEAEFNEWGGFAKRAVERYGVNGSFWQGKANPTPVTAWEIWNEPNLVANNPPMSKKECEQIGQFYYSEYSTCVQPANYGKFLISAAVAVRTQQNAQGFAPTILFGGLYTPGGDPYRHFLKTASAVPWATGAYDGVSVHPYAPFNSAEELGESGLKVKELEDSVNGLRDELDHGISGDYNKPIWITELGWPVAYGDANHPAVTEKQQATLLTKSINWIKNAATVDNIQAAYWYNYRDSDVAGTWDYRCGLRDEVGNFRLSWFAFQAETGSPRWPVPTVAFQANTTTLWIANRLSGANTGWGMQKETSPSIGQYGGTYKAAFQANTGTLWIHTPAGGTNTGQKMAPKTSPSVAPLDGNMVAYQSNTGNLSYQEGETTVNTGYAMAPGTSPSATAVPALYWRQPTRYPIAFQTSTGQLAFYEPGGSFVNTGLGMAPGSSPAIAALDGPGPRFAIVFQANTGQLWLYEPGGTVASTGLGMAPGTSPAVAAQVVAALPAPRPRYAIAFQANTGQLWLYEPGGTIANTGYGMQAGSSPSVSAISDYPYYRPYEIAFHTNGGQLWTYEPGGSVTNTLFGTQPGTSPSIGPG